MLKFNPKFHRLGPLCPNKHEYKNTNQSIYYINSSETTIKCIQCHKNYKKQWYHTNKNRLQNKSITYYYKNRLQCNIRKNIKNKLKAQDRTGKLASLIDHTISTEYLVGYTMEELLYYFESQQYNIKLLEENNTYEIHHKIPWVCFTDLRSVKTLQDLVPILRKIWNFDNLELLSKEEHKKIHHTHLIQDYIITLKNKI